MQIKTAAYNRFGDGSNAPRYIELAQKFLIGQIKPGSTDFKMNLDLVSKSEGKIFGMVMQDFTFLESIIMYTDVASFSAMEKREKMQDVPEKQKQEWEQTKLSCNTDENLLFINPFADHIRN